MGKLKKRMLTSLAFGFSTGSWPELCLVLKPTYTIGASQGHTQGISFTLHHSGWQSRIKGGARIRACLQVIIRKVPRLLSAKWLHTTAQRCASCRNYKANSREAEASRVQRGCEDHPGACRLILHVCKKWVISDSNNRAFSEMEEIFYQRRK